MRPPSPPTSAPTTLCYVFNGMTDSCKSPSIGSSKIFFSADHKGTSLPVPERASLIDSLFSAELVSCVLQRRIIRFTHGTLKIPSVTKQKSCLARPTRVKMVRLQLEMWLSGTWCVTCDSVTIDKATLVFFTLLLIYFITYVYVYVYAHIYTLMCL